MQTHCRFLLLFVSTLIPACATMPLDITPALPEPDKQYICQSKIIFSDATREFSLRTQWHGHPHVLHIGEPLTVQLPKIFWTDSNALHSGKPTPLVAVGFAVNTGAHTKDNGEEELHVGLQFQILQPTGQSYSDVVTGQSTRTETSAATTEALTQALLRLESILESAGICRKTQ